MRLARWISLAGCVLVSFLSTSTATADGREEVPAAVQRPTREDMNLDFRTVGQTYAMRERRVNERYIRDLGNGCDYVATVRGTMKPRDPRHGQPTYRSNLTLDARVECSGHVVATAPSFRLHTGRITENEMRQSLSSHGRIVAPAGDGRRCAYTPTYVVLNDRIETRAVWQACSVEPAAVGGGPRIPK